MEPTYEVKTCPSCGGALVSKGSTYTFDCGSKMKPAKSKSLQEITYTCQVVGGLREAWIIMNVMLMMELDREDGEVYPRALNWLTRWQQLEPKPTDYEK